MIVDRISLAASSLGLARKIVVAVTGGTVLAVGLALIVLPGPAVVVIPLGLAILATEFLWARRLLRHARQGTSRLLARRRSAPEPAVPVAVAMLSVVLSFSATIVFSHYRLEPVQDRALAISQDTTVAFEHLASIRTELRRVGMLANEYVLAQGSGATVSRDDAIDASRRAASALAAYKALPGCPGETEQLVKITESVVLCTAGSLGNTLDRVSLDGEEGAARGASSSPGAGKRERRSAPEASSRQRSRKRGADPPG